MRLFEKLFQLIQLLHGEVCSTPALLTPALQRRNNDSAAFLRYVPCQAFSRRKVHVASANWRNAQVFYFSNDPHRGFSESKFLGR